MKLTPLTYVPVGEVRSDSIRISLIDYMVFANQVHRTRLRPFITGILLMLLISDIFPWFGWCAMFFYITTLLARKILQLSAHRIECVTDGHIGILMRLMLTG